MGNAEIKGVDVSYVVALLFIALFFVSVYFFTKKLAEA